jgi:SWI/SNF-related matrix-associated actin-dependent regulator of chromatin subfamily A3
VYPYSELDIFDNDISRPWRGGEQQGFLRLKTLVRAITISRSKAIVNLPPRSDYIHHLDFSGEERVLYDDSKKQTVVLLQAAISSSQGGRTFNALQRLNTLRLICSHGLLAQSSQGTETSCQAQLSVAPYTQSYLQDPFYEDFFGGRSFCCYCGVDLLEDFLEGSPSAGLYTGSVATKSGPIMCERCQIQFDNLETHHSSRLEELLGFPMSPLSQSLSPSIEDEQARFPLELMPTKIKALVTDLSHHSSSEKR